jgi:hypothetical protein
MMEGKHILHVVFLKRMLAFLGISALSFFSVLTLLLPKLISIVGTQHKGGSDERQWLWSCVLFFLFLVNVVLDIWVISDSPSSSHFPFGRSLKRLFNACATGAPIGYCLQMIFLKGVFYSVTPEVCMVVSVLSLLCLRVDLEGRIVQFSPIPSTPVSQIPSCRGDVNDAGYAVLITSILALFLAYFTGSSLCAEDLLVSAAHMSLMVSLLKLGLDSLLVNIMVYPIDFDKLKPNTLSGDLNSAEYQIFNGNYFYAVQNFSFVLLLNSLTEGLGLEGISHKDFMSSFDSPLNLLSHQEISEKQAKYVDNLYLATASRLEAGSSGTFASRLFAHFKTPPAVSSRGAAAPPADADADAERPSLFHLLCRSLALRDLGRVARVSPFRRALIYRNPILLHRTMYALCSLIDYHAVQVLLICDGDLRIFSGAA